MLISQFSLLKYFHAAYFGPLRPSLRVYKQQNVSTFITNLRDAVDQLLIVLSYKKFFYLRLQCLNILNYLSNILKLV
jgi:hypothetical protein